MSETFCLWHGTELTEVTEWQQEQCNVAGMQCEGCEFLKVEGEDGNEQRNFIQSKTKRLENKS